jgi:hypothetical protein
MHVAGLGVGMKSTDADVVAALGPGCFVPDEPHGGGRYFTNPAQTFTLHSVVGVDTMTEVLELSQGLEIPERCHALAKSPPLVSKKLGQHPAVDLGLRLGMPVARLVAALGKPDEDRSQGSHRVLTYRASVDTDDRVTLAYEAKYRFRSGSLVRISLYDGE